MSAHSSEAEPCELFLEFCPIRRFVPEVLSSPRKMNLKLRRLCRKTVLSLVLTVGSGPSIDDSNHDKVIQIH
jgi:hypothetical protein